MEVDSFRYLSRLVTRYYKLAQVKMELPIPWSPLTKPLDQCRFGLVTSGGLYQRGCEPPFNVERERQEPSWGDPSFRTIPADVQLSEIGVSHLHLKDDDILADVNILLPIHRFKELAEEGRIGGLVSETYSFMGYQGFPADLTGWKDEYGPQVASRLQAEEVDCVFLTTA